jgi:predicted TIM-barrel fold metal-dependent hydrolase
MASRKIDIFNHVMPQKIADRMREMGPSSAGMAKRLTSIPMLYDIEARIRMMDQWPGYEQVLTIAGPIEMMAPVETGPELARLANAELKNICDTRPDKFPAWVASLPLATPDKALEEMDRAVAEGAKGIQIFTNMNGMAMDHPSLFPIFERATEHYGIPIWMHPARNSSFADYATETKSKYEIWQVFGWPYETSAAMARMVFSGMFDKLPQMRLITHHLGAMVPYFEGRVGPLWDQLGTRTVDEDYSPILAAMKAKGRRPIDYFRMFYNDTAIGAGASAIRCGIDFFGAERVLFASDCPFDPEGGPQFIRETIKVLDEMDLSDAERDAIYFGNAESMLTPCCADHG